MKSASEIEQFLTHEFVPTLRKLSLDTPPVWGTMNVWQMIEHIAWPFKASNGQFKMPLTTPEDKVERIKNIGLLNDKPMQRNFNNPILTDEMRKPRNASVDASLIELQNDINLFIQYFKTRESNHTEIHNIFGPLNYNEWLQFHYKHVKHHLEQFGVVIE